MAGATEFIDGFFAKAPHENAPDFVKAKVNIKREELLAWLTNREEEWISVDIKEGRSGKWYASVDDWRPSGESSGDPQSRPAEPFSIDNDGSDRIPFEGGTITDFDDDSVPF